MRAAGPRTFLLAHAIAWLAVVVGGPFHALSHLPGAGAGGADVDEVAVAAGPAVAAHGVASDCGHPPALAHIGAPADDPVPSCELCAAIAAGAWAPCLDAPATLSAPQLRSIRWSVLEPLVPSLELATPRERGPPVLAFGIRHV